MRMQLVLLTLMLGYGLIGSTQSCREKCDQTCKSAFTNPQQSDRCKAECYQNNCAVSTTSKTPTPPPLRPWDVVQTSYGLDPNGFYRDPQWWWALTNGGGKLLDVCDFCPCGVNSPQLWSEQARCTNQTLHINQGNPLCGGYHMNWFPVELDGGLRFEDHEPSIAGDDDYEFDILGPDSSLVTAGRSDVHLEFNATETVDDWDGTGTWWENFHHNIVDKYWNNKAYRQQWFGQHYGIVIGMLGVDEEHADHHSELHPVYAMFIKLNEPISPLSKENDQWAFFVRNWGNEGYCGPGDEPLNDYRQIRIRIGGGALVSSNIAVYAHGAATLFADEYSLDQCFAQSSVGLSAGELTFNLPPAIGKCGLVGDLTVKHPANVVGSLALAPWTSPKTESERKEIDPGLATRIGKLSLADQQVLENQLADIIKAARTKPLIRKLKVQELKVPPSQTQHRDVRTVSFKAVPDRDGQTFERQKRQAIEKFLNEHRIQ